MGKLEKLVFFLIGAIFLSASFYVINWKLTENSTIEPSSKTKSTQDLEQELNSIQKLIKSLELKMETVTQDDSKLSSKDSREVETDKPSENVSHKTKTKSPEKRFSEMKSRFSKAFSRISSGCLGVEEMSCLLQPLYNGGVIIDVGANVGFVASTFLSVFNNIETYYDKIPTVCRQKFDPIQVYSVEASPETYQVLLNRSSIRNWDRAGFHSYNFAVSDVDKMGSFFIDKSTRESEQSSLSQEGANKDPNLTIEVKIEMKSLDTFFKEEEIDKIFILKIDTEGYDPIALRGAFKTLEKGIARFVGFEYGRKWQFSSSYTLKDAVDWMNDFNYACFIIGKILVPLYGDWWDTRYTRSKWVNVFCLKKDDQDLMKILFFYNQLFIPNDLIPEGFQLGKD